jgi:hypothetical protein
LPKLQPTNFWYQGILGIKWQHNKFQNDVVNLLYGVAIAFAIVALQKNGGALAINVSSEIQEERCKKSLSTSFKTSLLPTLVASMKEELLIALCDPAILSKYIFGIQWGPWYIKSRYYIGGSFIITRLSMTTQLDFEDFLGSLQEHLIFYIQHYMMILCIILLMLLK